MAKGKSKSIPSLALPATVRAQLDERAAEFADLTKTLQNFAGPVAAFADLSKRRLELLLEPPEEMIPMDEIGNSIPEELAELRKLITELKAPAPSPPKKRKAWQVDRACRALRKRYPPDGCPPDEISTDALREQVKTDLKSERPDLPAPSWSSVARAAGRRSK